MHIIVMQMCSAGAGEASLQPHHQQPDEAIVLQQTNVSLAHSYLVPQRLFAFHLSQTPHNIFTLLSKPGVQFLYMFIISFIIAQGGV